MDWIEVAPDLVASQSKVSIRIVVRVLNNNTACALGIIEILLIEYRLYMQQKQVHSEYIPSETMRTLGV